MSVKRLKVPSGVVTDTATPVQDTPDRIVRRALLVHSGPGGAAVTFGSADGEIHFDDARIQAVVDSQNDLIDKLAEHYGGFEKIPAGAFPPILDQHEADSTNRVIGRLTGRLTFERRSVPKVGDDVACAVADITFMGRETTDRVKDGRIFHLSIGIDEGTNTLTETSAVIDPAAPGAMILKKGPARKLAKGVTLDQQKKALERRTKLAAAQKDLKKLSAKLVANGKALKMAAAENNVKAHLKRLAAGGKITGAEIKNMDVKRLATLAPDHLKILVDSFEAREPVVVPGQIGTAAAANFSDVAKGLEKKQTKRLRAEIKGDLRRMGAKLKSDDRDDDDGKDHKSMSDKPADEKKLEDGETSTAVETVPQVDPAVDTEKMQQQMDELATQVSRIAGVVADLVDESQAGDPSEMDGDDDDDTEMKSDDDDKKEDQALEADDKHDDDKKDLASDEKADDDDDKKSE